jgi:hypothetical protein
MKAGVQGRTLRAVSPAGVAPHLVQNCEKSA